MPSVALGASCGCKLGDVAWLDGREDRRLESDEIESRLLGTAGGGIGRENEAERSDGVSSMTAVLVVG